MELNIKDTEKLLKLFKTHPLKTLLICVLSFLLLAAGAYVYSYFGEKGKRHATSPNMQPASSPLQGDEIEPKNRPLTPPPQHRNSVNKNEDSESRRDSSYRNKIIQQPKGDQSPAVIVGPGGKSEITYGPTTKKGEE